MKIELRGLFEAMKAVPGVAVVNLRNTRRLSLAVWSISFLTESGQTDSLSARERTAQRTYNIEASSSHAYLIAEARPLGHNASDANRIDPTGMSLEQLVTTFGMDEPVARIWVGHVRESKNSSLRILG